MYISSIELKGYNRFELNNITHFTATYTAAVQFIIGSNGSGKSSLAYQLSPLPAEKEDFSSTGRKHVRILNNGKQYDLISDFAEEHVHQFKVDGTNLNEGGTITVQKELVKKHFGYDNAIHEMVHGLKEFTKMGPGERKHWFTFLADADFDYAIRLFDKVKERLNQMQSASKLAKQRLVIESSKVISEEEYARLKEECESLYNNVQFLIEHREKPNGTTAQYKDRFFKLKNQITLLTTEVYKRLKYAHKNHLSTPEALLDLKDKLKQDFATAQAQSTHFYEEFEHLDKLWNTWKTSQLQSIANIDQEIQSAQNEIAQSSRRLVFSFESQLPAEVVIESCDQAAAAWPAVQYKLHDNRIKNYTRETLEALLIQIDQLKAQQNEALRIKERAQGIVDHQKSHASDAPIDCPKCSHRFVISFDPQKLEQAQSIVATRKSQADSLQEQIQELETKRMEMQAYFQHLREAAQIFYTYPGLKPLLNYINDGNYLHNQPDKVGQLIEQFKADASIRLSIERCTTRIEAAKNLLEQTQGSDLSASDIESRRNRAETQVALCEQRKRSLQLELEAVDKHIRVLTSMNDMVLQLKHHKEDIHNLANEAVENVRRLEYDNLLRDLQSLLATKEQALQASDRQLSVIEHITKQINEFTADIEDYKILVKELSPTEGLIAEGIFSFMRKFVNDMNRFIRLVWTYPLEIKPCALEKEGSLLLNYKFPLLVDKESSTRKDVSQGSSAMLEIINLVFRITAMKALGLGKFPLILDEFGSGFDHVHKGSIVHMLSALVDLDQADQIFVISHDFSHYTALGTSEICALHEANVILPVGVPYNKHVSMR